MFRPWTQISFVLFYYENELSTERPFQGGEEDSRSEDYILSEMDRANPESTVQAASDPEKLCMKKEELAMVHEALQRMKSQHPEDALLIELRFMKSLTYAEAAKILDKKPDAVKKQFTRKKTGSLARFEEIFTELSREGGI